MYKLLLCQRYLRTRYIALASIMSVMLGVATMIVVNSVMDGFQHEMYNRLHGILSDVVVESIGMDGIRDPEAVMAEIRETVGDDLAGMTASIHLPAMLAFKMNGQWRHVPISLVGIDQGTYAEVSDFGKYLVHPQNQERIDFQLRNDGYQPRIDYGGWQYRRERVAMERAYQQQRRKLELTDDLSPLGDRSATGAATAAVTSSRPPEAGPSNVSDPFLARQQQLPQDVFDELKQQHTGVVLGISLVSARVRDAEGAVVDRFFCRPGDDVKITMPSAGTPPQAVSNLFTVVDFYESKMSEYDASFAFVPLAQLQKFRGMIDPSSGTAAVTSIQLKLAAGADLDAVRDRLRDRFPPQRYGYQVQTWRDMQGPLLAAVQMETTILNILLFLIIAVAGFGILATFFMIVVEKTRDIGVLKSLGASSRGVMSVFLGYGLSLGIVGSGVGMALGLAFVLRINDIAALLERCTGREVFDPTIYYFQQIPTVIDPFTIAWIVVGAMGIAVMASVLPAIRAARLHPVEALRYE